MNPARTVSVLLSLAMAVAAALPALADQRKSGRGGPARGSGAGTPSPQPLPGPYPGPGMGTYPGPVMGTYPGPIVGTFPRGPYRGFGPYYGRPRYAAPYYHFRPRVTVGGGLWLGYPVPFPQMRYAAPFMYVYPYPVAPYGYTTPYPPTHSAYPPLATPIYPPGTSLDDPARPRDTGIAVSPPPTGFGGMSLDLTPADAEVWVDGGFTGMADDFGPQRDPLTLTPGVHRIELRAPGYVTALFDVTINAGQVLPYQGGLKPVP